jgi:hypothetical protein
MINLLCNSKNDVTKQLLLPMLEFIQKCMFSRVFLFEVLWNVACMCMRECVYVREGDGMREDGDD